MQHNLTAFILASVFLLVFRVLKKNFVLNKIKSVCWKTDVN